MFVVGICRITRITNHTNIILHLIHTECGRSLKCATVVNGLSGDADIILCNVITEYFQSVYRPNTPDADLQYEKQVQNWLEQKTDCSKCVTSVDINDVQRCVDKMKSKKGSWS